MNYIDIMDNENKLAFRRKNYIIMLIGIVVIVLGYIFMTLDNETYGFGIMGLTIGPMTILVGFVIEFFAILHKPKEN